ncbi:MAG TPA: PEP-CTERM sorting domain-containing protein [Telluria sp.]|nr:PEP-CTERM sorting domain-containing protein [Telluria sp.]
MKKFLRFAAGAIGFVAATMLSAAASATVLTSSLSVDNGFFAYISTSDADFGTVFSQGNDWATTYTDSTTLNAGTDYYLHVFGYDQGGVAGMLGQFSLSGTDHVFANGTTSLLTNTTDWSGSMDSFGTSYTALTVLGNNGVGPWGTRPDIGSGATWIWVGDANNNDLAFFSTKISATAAGADVPEPASAALLGLGLLAVAATRRKTTKRR